MRQRTIITDEKSNSILTWFDVYFTEPSSLWSAFFERHRPPNDIIHKVQYVQNVPLVLYEAGKLRGKLSEFNIRGLRSVGSRLAGAVAAELLGLQLVKNIVFLNQLCYQTYLVKYYLNKIDVDQS